MGGLPQKPHMHLGSKLVWSLKHGARKFAQISYYLLQMLKVQKPLGGRERPVRCPEENVICKPTKGVPICAKDRSRVQASVVTRRLPQTRDKDSRGTVSQLGLSSFSLFKNQLLHNKFSSLKQYTFIISQFLCIRNMARVQLGLCFTEAAIKVVARTVISSKSSNGKGCAFKLTWLLARFSFLRAVGLRVSIPLRARDWRLLSLPCHVGLYTWLFRESTSEEPETKYHQKGPARWKSQSFITKSLKRLAITFPLICSLEASYQPILEGSRLHME